RYQWAKKNALTRLGDHERVIQTDSHALEVAPDAFYPRASRAYEYILVGKPREAEKDLALILAADPRETNSQLNLAIALAMQQRYDEAVSHIHEAINSSVVHDGTSMDSEVWPDIRHATGRDILQASDTELNLAMFYEIAIVRAAQGSSDFEAALAAADEQVNRRMSRTTEAGRIMNLQFVAFN